MGLYHRARPRSRGIEANPDFVDVLGGYSYSCDSLRDRSRRSVVAHRHRMGGRHGWHDARRVPFIVQFLITDGLAVLHRLAHDECRRGPAHRMVLASLSPRAAPRLYSARTRCLRVIAEITALAASCRAATSHIDDGCLHRRPRLVLAARHRCDSCAGGARSSGRDRTRAAHDSGGAPRTSKERCAMTKATHPTNPTHETDRLRTCGATAP